MVEIKNGGKKLIYMSVLIFPVLIFGVVIALFLVHVFLNREVRDYSKIKPKNKLAFLEFRNTINPSVKLIEGKRFLYRPIFNEIIYEKKFDGSWYGTLALLHELYHSQDRQLVLVSQIIYLTIMYLISPILKLLIISGLLLDKVNHQFLFMMWLDIFVLLLAFLLITYIETRASRMALKYIRLNLSLSLDEIRCIKKFYHFTLWSHLIPIISSIIIVFIPMTAIWQLGMR